MATKSRSPKETLHGAESQAKVLLLLALWDLESSDTGVKRTDVTNRVKRDKDKAEPYRDFLAQLEKDGAVVIKKERSVKVSLCKPHGLVVQKSLEALIYGQSH